MPALKNSKKITRTGHIYTDKRIKDFMDNAKDEVAVQWRNPVLPELEQLTVVIYNHDERKHDLSNQLDTVCDIIKGIIVKDDDQKCIPSIQLQYGGIDKENPRTEIWVDFSS